MVTVVNKTNLRNPRSREVKKLNWIEASFIISILCLPPRQRTCPTCLKMHRHTRGSRDRKFVPMEEFQELNPTCWRVSGTKATLSHHLGPPMSHLSPHHHHQADTWARPGTVNKHCLTQIRSLIPSVTMGWICTHRACHHPPSGTSSPAMMSPLVEHRNPSLVPHSEASLMM